MSRYKKATVGLLFLILIWVVFFLLLFMLRLTHLNELLNIKGEIDIFIELNDKGTELYTILSGEKDYINNMVILGSSAAENTPKDFNEHLEDSLDSMASSKDAEGYYLNVWSYSNLIKGFGMKVVKGSVRSAVTKDIVDKFFQTHNSPLEGLGECIVDASERTGVPSLVIISVAVHESGWGNSDLANSYCPTSSPYNNPANTLSNNLFGYKPKRTSTGTLGTCRWRTWECLKAEPPDILGKCSNPCGEGEECYYVVEEFNSYITKCNSVNDFAEKIRDNYKKAMRYVSNPERMIKEMGPDGAGYATDPAWDDKVIDIMDAFLMEYPYAVIPAEGVYAEIPLPNGEKGRIEMVI